MYLNMYTVALQRDATFLRALQRKNPLPLHCKAMRRHCEETKQSVACVPGGIE